MSAATAMLSLTGVQQANSRLQICTVILNIKKLNPFLSFLSLIWALAGLASSASSKSCTLKFSRDAGITVSELISNCCPHLKDVLVFYPRRENYRISDFSEWGYKKCLQKGEVSEQEHPMSFSLVVSCSKEMKNPSWCWLFISIIHYQAQLVISQSHLLEIHASVKMSNFEKPGGLAPISR